MRRYFFDLIGQTRPLYDFHGRKFSDPVDAHKLAQLLALNLEVENEEDFLGGRVDVRDTYGGAIFSVGIRATEPGCA